MFVEGNLTFGFADLRLRLGRMIMNPSLFRTPSPALFFVLCVCVCVYPRVNSRERARAWLSRPSFAFSFQSHS